MATDGDELFDAYWTYIQETDADTALWSGDVAYLERWPDVTPDGEAEHSRRLVAFADAADRLGVESATAETVAFTARAAVDQLTWQAELRRPNPAIGTISNMLVFLGRFPLVDANHGERYLAKLAALPRYLEDLGGRLGQAAQSGLTPIACHVASAIRQLDGYLASPLENDPITAQPPPTEMAEPARERWSAEVATHVRDVVRPAMDQYRRVLVDVTAPAARPDDLPGLVHIPGGDEVYRRLLVASTSLPLDAEAIHTIGQEQVNRVEQELVEIAGPLLGATDIGDIHRQLRDDPNLHYSDAKVLVADARSALAAAQAAAPDWFGRVPNAACVATEITSGALAFYSPPSDDGTKPGTFFFNIGDPAAWGTFQLRAITYHEGVPGHHFQLARALETPGLHPVHSKVFLPAFGEGWGLYTERLADEMGLYATEWDRVGMVSTDSLRAVRLVVDTGIHAYGWSRDEAIDYMLKHTPLARAMIEGEIDRYIGMPGQATSYMIGRLEFDSIRSAAESVLRERFDIAGFHDAVLDHGSIPLPTLRRRVEAWVASLD